MDAMRMTGRFSGGAPTTSGFSPSKYSSTKVQRLPQIQFFEQLQKYIPTEKTDRTTFEYNFLSHRSGLKDFYKNQQYKVITKDGALVDNKEKVLLERSRKGQSSHNGSVSGKFNQSHHLSKGLQVDASNMNIDGSKQHEAIDELDPLF